MREQWQDDEEEETTRGMTLVAYVITLFFVILIVVTVMERGRSNGRGEEGAEAAPESRLPHLLRGEGLARCFHRRVGAVPGLPRARLDMGL